MFGGFFGDGPALVADDSGETGSFFRSVLAGEMLGIKIGDYIHDKKAHCLLMGERL